jgi:hypothetical protein
MRPAVSWAQSVGTVSDGATSIVPVLEVDRRASLDTVIESVDEHFNEIITPLVHRTVFFETEASSARHRATITVEK